MEETKSLGSDAASAEQFSWSSVILPYVFSGFVLDSDFYFRFSLNKILGLCGFMELALYLYIFMDIRSSIHQLGLVLTS